MGFLLLAPVVLFAHASSPANVFQLPAAVLTTGYDTGVLLLTLQGLINRHPRTAVPLFLDTVEVFNQYYGADAHWISYLEATKNVTFNNLTASGLRGVLEAGESVVDGVVLYDGGSAPEPDATRYIALTLCGLESLLPVTPALMLAYPQLAAFPVRHDLRGAFTSNADAYAFAFSHLLPRVNRSVGWSAGRTHIDDAGWEVWQGSPPEMPLLGR